MAWTTTIGIGQRLSSPLLHSLTRRPQLILNRHFLKKTISSRHSVSVLLSTIDSNNNEKARVIFLGTPDVAATCLRSIVEDSKKMDSPFEVVSVITQPPKRRKRGGKVSLSPVGEVAEELNIPIMSPEKANNSEFLDELEKIKPDLCITAAYGQYLPKRFLNIPKHGTLNIHPSLLPLYRGASPVQRSLQAGDNPLGVTVLFTVSKMDAGPIVSQKECPIEDHQQATDVLPYLFDIGTDCLLEVMGDVLSDKVTMDNAKQQDDECATNAAMIDPQEGELKVWEDGAKTCHDKVRGFSMWPGTFMYFKIGEEDEATRVKVILTRVAKQAGEEECTDLVELGETKKDGLMVVCKDGSVLELIQVQPATRKLMDARSFVNGLRGKELRWVNN